MTDITIPPEALEAAQREIESYLGLIEPDPTEMARAACLAMLKNWEGMQYMDWNSRFSEFSSHIILPFPKEPKS
jgi:hypothetical protein